MVSAADLSGTGAWLRSARRWAVGDGVVSPHDATELQACFAAHARELFGYACVLTRGDLPPADDLVQAAFEAAGLAWHALRRMDETQRRNWLRTTLADIAVNGLRRQAAFRDPRPRISGHYRRAPAGHAEPAFSPNALERCWQAIRAMQEPQHAVALLRWQLGMKEAEIAAVLGMTEETVTAHLLRARSKLIGAIR